MNIKNIFAGAAFALTVAIVNVQFVSAAVSPSSVEVKIEEVWASESASCGDMVQIWESDGAATYQDLVSGPTFGEMTVTNGTYNCIAWKMSDIMRLVPAATEGNCVQGNTYTRDLFRAGDSSVGPDGTNIAGSGNPEDPGMVENYMYIFLSTGAGVQDNSSGYTAGNPMPLGSAFVVSGDKVGTMVVDMTNGLEDVGATCSVENVTFSFR